MPAIRNGILMVLSHKTSGQLLSREGKLALAREIMREAALPMGIETGDDEAAEPEAEAADGDDEKPKKKKRKKASVDNPIKAVHFSNFIVQ
jgi:flagellar FliL protein